MARTRQAIKKEITATFMGNEVVALKYGFEIGANYDQEFSLVSIENFLFEFIALAIFILEQLFDQHKKEVDVALANQKSGTLPWYRTMALRFQYGFDLVPDHDFFDNSNATLAEIEASKIIKYSAVNESQQTSRVIIKIAGESGNVLAPLNNEQKESFEEYIKEIRFAGVAFTVINYLPDRLYLNIQIQRDSLVLNQYGMSILNGNYPVNEAIMEFMKNLPFNGEFRLSNLIDKLKIVEGVKDATILSAQSSWINPEINDYGDFQPIYISALPVSGYYEVLNFDTIAYVE